MAATLSEGVRKLLAGQNFAHLATLMPDGSPQVTVVWVDVDGDEIVVNTAEGRQKPRNLRADPRVALSVAGQANPYEAAFIRGRVVAMTHDGADDHIDKMAKKYTGQERYQMRAPGEQRLLIRIRPEHVSTMGVS
jgi:PPOX class probable F420-dependent enzyme